jgi:hypothetical protein
MKLPIGEAEEPPSRPRAGHRLLSNPHLPINALTPAAAPGLASSLAVLTARAEQFPVGPKARAFRKRYFPDVDPAQWNDWRWQARPAKQDDQSKTKAKQAEKEAKERYNAIRGYEEAAKKLPPAAGAPECVWTGQRIASLLWRDDLGTASRYMDLYKQFDCSPDHLKLAFRCVVKQGPIDLKAAEDLASRVHKCWLSPEGPPPKTDEAANATNDGTKSK